MRLKKLLPIAVGGGLGGPLLIFVLIMVFYPNLFVSGIIKKKLETEFGGKAVAEEVYFGWKSGVEISNLFIKDEKGDKPILKVDSVHLKLAILPLLKDKLIIQQLVADRPEMVIYRGGSDGQKGPSLDGAPELKRTHERRKGPAGFYGGKHAFPEIIEAVINDGTFIFTDLNSGESTKIEKLNLTLNGLRPAGTARINGECDITGGGGQDHTAIAGNAQGFDSPGLMAFAGNLVFKSGFANVQAAVDMNGLNNPGTRILDVSVDGDLQNTVSRLGVMLSLSKDTRMKGVIDSAMTAVSQPGGSMVLEGETSAADLYIKVPPYLTEPFSSSRTVLSYLVDVNLLGVNANIKKFALSADDINLGISGIVHGDGAVDAEVHLAAALKDIMARLVHVYKPPSKLKVFGRLTSDAKIQGTLGDTLALEGTSKIGDLELELGSHQYTDPEVVIYHDLDYDQNNAVINVKKVKSTLGLLALNLTQGLVKMGENGYYQGKLDLVSDMLEVTRLLDLPRTVSLKKTGTVNLNFKGPITHPLYNNISADGTISIDELIYENYEVTGIKIENFTLENNLLIAHLDMLINGTPADVVFNIDLALDKPGGPYTEAELHAINVPVTQVFKNGTISGLVTLNVNKARGEGIDWKKELKETLTADGDIKLENGKLSASDLVVSLLKHFGQPGNAYHIESLTTDFDIHDQTIYTPKSEKFTVVGKPFDIELSGSVGFNEQLDYLVTVFVPREKVGKDLQKIFSSMQNDPKITLKLTGRLSKPKVNIAGDALLKDLLDTKHMFKDVESMFKDIFK